MIPIHLTIEGLYSYQTRQEIDFTLLNDAGLFGIFGKVGSGKSSVLEAISFALYEETERLNRMEKRGYNMMNLKSNRSFIAFEFLNFENKLYRVEREYRRNSKKFEDIKHSYTTFYQKINDSWIPIDKPNVEQIVGMSYTNFKRTVIIPQGQFKEFLELTEKDRTQMLQEIFNLDRFDLSEKTAELYSKTNEELSFKEGEMQSYQHTTEQLCTELENKFKNTTKQLSEIKNKYQFALDRLDKMQKLKEKIEKLKLQEERKEKLELKDSEIKQKENEIKEYEEVSHHFAGKISLYDDKKYKLNTQKSNSEKEEKELEILKNNLKQEQERFEPIRKDYINIENHQKKLKDLEQLINRTVLEKEIKEVEKRLENGKKVIEENILKLEVERKKKKEKEEELSSLKTQQIPTEQLLEIEKWYGKYNYINEQINESNKTLSKIDNELNNIDTYLKNHQWDWESSPNEFQSEIKKLKQEKEQYEEKLSTVEVHEKLSSYTSQLHQTGICPLCGSKEHPQILETASVEKEKTLLQQEILSLKKQIEKIEEKERDFAKKLSEFNTKKELKKNASQILEDKQKELLVHNKSFQWRDFCADGKDFEEKKNKSLYVEKQIEQLQKDIEGIQKNIDLYSKNDERYTKVIEEFKMAINLKKQQLKATESSLQVFKISEVENVSIQDFEKQYENLKNLIDETLQSYEKMQEYIQTQQQNISKKEGSFEANILAVKQLEREVFQLEKELNDLIFLKKFSSIEKVKLILNKNLNLSNLRNEINDFYTELNLVKKEISRLQEDTKDQCFSQEAYETQEKDVNQLKTSLDVYTKQEALQENEWKQQVKMLAEKQILEDKLKELQNREQNLKIMKNLFKSLGFVQYIANVYLRELCDVANQRFHRLTRNQLSLSVSEKGQLEIIDYLNDGKPRSVKTLSGGQSFQASLSLALALAESTQSPELSKKFFFIDEGFGTQDSESVHTIFETLSQLQNENHIVGIISHLEALKEQIPLSLSVVKTEEGSVVK